MGWYIFKLLLLLPLLGLLIWFSLSLSKKLQAKMAIGGRTRAVRLVETTMLSPGIKLAVVEFHGKEILLGSSRSGLTRLAECNQDEIRANDPDGVVRAPEDQADGKDDGASSPARPRISANPSAAQTPGQAANSQANSQANRSANSPATRSANSRASCSATQLSGHPLAISEESAYDKTGNRETGFAPLAKRIASQIGGGSGQ